MEQLELFDSTKEIELKSEALIWDNLIKACKKINITGFTVHCDCGACSSFKKALNDVLNIERNKK
jgi:hypothetical protein